MATVHETIYKDSLTGEQLGAYRVGAEPAARPFRTRRLTLDNQLVELHLSDASNTALEKALEPFLAADPASEKLPTAPPRKSAVERKQRQNGGKKAPPKAAPQAKRPTRAGSGRSAERELSQAVRQWCTSKGATLKPKGKLPGWAWEAYNAQDPKLLKRK